MARYDTIVLFNNRGQMVSPALICRQTGEEKLLISIYNIQYYNRIIADRYLKESCAYGINASLRRTI
jgi:hypothetical protein